MIWGKSCAKTASPKYSKFQYLFSILLHFHQNFHAKGIEYELNFFTIMTQYSNFPINQTINWKYNFHANIEINKSTNDFISWIRYCKEIVDLTRIWYIFFWNTGIPKKLDKYCDMLNVKIKMLYHQSRCENFNVLLFLRKCRFKWGPCIRCFVLRNLKPITLSNCYQTQKNTSLENSENEC